MNISLLSFWYDKWLGAWRFELRRGFNRQDSGKSSSHYKGEKKESDKGNPDHFAKEWSAINRHPELSTTVSLNLVLANLKCILTNLTSYQKD